MLVMHRDMVVYNYNGMSLTHTQLLSMLPYSRVDEGVVNGWSACLNYNEKYKSPESPYRLFLSTFPSVSIGYLYILGFCISGPLYIVLIGRVISFLLSIRNGMRMKQ